MALNQAQAQVLPSWLGYGYGDGDGKYWLNCVANFAAKWPQAQQDRLAALQAEGSKIAYWRSTQDAKPANGGACDAVAPGIVHTEPGPLRDECGAGQLHATLLPPKWKGARYWIVALIGEWRGNDEKMWALKREVLGECE